MATYDILNRLEYFKHLIARCDTAKKGDIIVLMTLEFRPDQKIIQDLVDALGAAAERGAKVLFLVDAYSFMLKAGSILGPVFFRKKEPKLGYGQFKDVVQTVQKLRERGVLCEVINKPTRGLKNPFRDRSHIKYAVINDEVLIGGCNLSHPEQLDVMVRTYGKKLANYLINFAEEVMEAKDVRLALNHRDVVFKVDKETELLIDAGVRRQSVIYDKAFQLIDKASQKIYMTCQYFPNSRTPAELAKAHDRGVDVHLVYNHPFKHKGPVRGAQKRTVAYKKKRLPESVFKNQLDIDDDYLHAKILLSEKEGIIGSHNFVKLGVNLGTAEIALRSTSKEFIDVAQKWIEDL